MQNVIGYTRKSSGEITKDSIATQITLIFQSYERLARSEAVKRGIKAKKLLKQ